MTCPHCQREIPQELIPLSEAAKVMNRHAKPKKRMPFNKGLRKTGPLKHIGRAWVPRKLVDRLKDEDYD